MKNTSRKLLISAMLLTAVSAVGATSIKPVAQVYADEAEETSLVSEEAVSSEEEKPGFDYNKIVIDGKTIEQWKKEIADENTRTTALVGLFIFLCGVVAFLLKWLSERGLIKKNNLKIEETQKQLEELAKQYNCVNELYEKLKEITDNVIEISDSIPEKVNNALEQARNAYEEQKEILLIQLKKNPQLYENGTYKEVMQLVERNKYEESKEE